MQTTRQPAIRRLTQLALLTAVQLVMTFTPLGLVPLGPINASLLSIPVAIGAMLLGPAAGAWLGFVFGFFSFLDALQGKSAMGAALFAVSPLRYFLMAVGARVLMGVCAALIYRAVLRALPGHEKTAAAVGGFAAPFLNTVFYMGAMVALFYGCDYVQSLVASKGVTNAFAFVVSMVSVQAAVEWAVGCFVSAAVTVPLKKVVK